MSGERVGCRLFNVTKTRTTRPFRRPLLTGFTPVQEYSGVSTPSRKTKRERHSMNTLSCFVRTPFPFLFSYSVGVCYRKVPLSAEGDDVKPKMYLPPSSFFPAPRAPMRVPVPAPCAQKDLRGQPQAHPGEGRRRVPGHGSVQPRERRLRGGGGGGGLPVEGAGRPRDDGGALSPPVRLQHAPQLDEAFRGGLRTPSAG